MAGRRCWTTLARVLELSSGTLQIEVRDVLVGEDHVAAVLAMTGEREGRTIQDRTIQLFRIRDGRIAERWAYPEDQQALDAFWQ
jgi:uncharacterized protein